MVGRLGDLDRPADVGDGFALGDQLLSRLELADDLLGCVADAFHGGIPGPVWPDEDSHSPWTDLRGPGHPKWLRQHKEAVSAKPKMTDVRARPSKSHDKTSLA